jgi:hypothetical protein
VADYHCLEVWNVPWEPQNQASLEEWLKLLAKGRRIPATAGSDYHRPEDLGFKVPRNLGAPCTWVFAPGASQAADILGAIRAGHASLSEQPGGPLLELRAGPGYAALGGDLLPRPPGPLAVQVRCLNGSGGELRLLDQNGLRFSQHVGRQSLPACF